MQTGQRSVLSNFDTGMTLQYAVCNYQDLYSCKISVKNKGARPLNAFPLRTHLQLEISLFSSSYLSTISPTTAARMFYILDLCVAPHLNYDFRALPWQMGQTVPEFL